MQVRSLCFRALDTVVYRTTLCIGKKHFFCVHKKVVLNEAAGMKTQRDFGYTGPRLRDHKMVMSWRPVLSRRMDHTLQSNVLGKDDRRQVFFGKGTGSVCLLVLSNKTFLAYVYKVEFLWRRLLGKDNTGRNMFSDICGHIRWEFCHMGVDKKYFEVVQNNVYHIHDGILEWSFLPSLHKVDKPQNIFQRTGARNQALIDKDLDT